VALLAAYPDRTLSAWSATGYHELAQYLAGEITEDEAVQRWVRAERAYAKRQLTWLKREHVDLRLDVTQPEWQTHGLVEIARHLGTR
jgi:tRNA A37 N6-isopentenylltransferase MiaA